MLKYGIPDLRTFYDSRSALAPALRLSAARHPVAGARAAQRRCGGMKTTLAWLQDHLDTEAPIAGDRRAADHARPRCRRRSKTAPPALAAFTVVARGLGRAHPNADRLRVCLVDTGKEQVQVVCGAPNARAGMKGVFGPAGIDHPAHRRGAERKRDPRRRLARHADVGRRTGARRRSRRHHRICRRTRRSAPAMPSSSGSTTRSSTSR